MNVEGLKPWKWQRWGGDADWDDPSQIPIGVALLNRNSRFRAESVATRFGRKNTMVYEGNAGDVTGLDVLNVIGPYRTQIPLVWTATGILLQESPSGSGTLVPVNPPIVPNVADIYMQSARTENRIYMAWSDLLDAITPPQVLDGPTGVISPVSQNSIGAIWAPGTEYLVGDSVRTSQNPSRWFRCIFAGLAGPNEPNWPTLDGYLTQGSFPHANIISITVSAAIGHTRPALNIASVDSTFGFVVGGTITVAGNSNPALNGTWTIYAIGTNSISWTPAAEVGGSGGTMTQSTGGNILGNAATVTDANGGSQWVEWTPAAVQFLPAPEAPELITSIKGQAGAPSGTIASGQDIYVCFAYQNSIGETVWTAPVIYTNTATNDVLEVFFQLQGEVPGPSVAPAFGAAGYGGPRMPEWLISVIGLSDPKIAWPALACLNVYVAAVTTATAAPSVYYQIASGSIPDAPVVISSIPNSGTTFSPRSLATAALTSIPFVGESGPRYMAVERVDLNDSFVPVDPGSPLLVNFQSSIAEPGTANITFIQRSNNIVTCTVDQLVNFTQGGVVIIAGVANSTFDGTFNLLGASPNQFGGATLLWAQTADDAASSGGTAQNAAAASAFITPQALIATITRDNGTSIVSAVINSLQGLNVGSAVSVSGVTDASFDGQFAIATIVPDGSDPGGTVTWTQAGSNASSTGGILVPTGAGVGTNAPQTINFIGRGPLHSGPGFNVSCAVLGQGLPAGFAAGATVVVASVSPSDLNGTFTVVAAEASIGLLGPEWAIQYNQPGSTETGTGGTVTLVSGAPAQSQQGNISAISRSSGTVTATMDTVANFIVGAQAQANGVTDASYDGVFTILTVNTGSNQLTWAQPGANSSSSGGTVTQITGPLQQPTPVAILPPGGQFISQDIASFSVQGSQQAGPFFYVPEQDPVTPFTTSIISIGVLNGTVTALLKDASGLQPGDTIQVSNTTNKWFDGVFVLAEVTGNTIVYAGSGPGTGFSGGSLSLIPTLPSVEVGQNNPIAITSLVRNSAGLVSAQVADVTNLEPGMRIGVAGTLDATFAGQFTLLSVAQPSSPLASNAGTVTWQSGFLSSSNTTGGLIFGLPGILADFDDEFLSSAVDITPQLASLGAPPSIDVAYLPSVDRMVWTPGNASSFWFSNQGDVANIGNPGGILGVDQNNGNLTICCREMTNGEIIGMKENGGYALTPNDNTPSGWGVNKRWGGEDDPGGPVGPKAVGMGHNWLTFFAYQTGPYRYFEGQIEPLGHEKQGTWDRCNWDVAEQFWIAVDESKREVHYHVALDGATTCNHDEVLNYFNGWEDPLIFSPYAGTLIPNRHGRRWSDHDSTARTGGKFKRTLAPPVDSRVDRYQLLSGTVADGETNIVAVQMEQPDQYWDDALASAPAGGYVQVGIDHQYLPCFIKNDLLNILIEAVLSGRALGNGVMIMAPTRQNPNFQLSNPPTVDLTTPPAIAATCLGPEFNNEAPLPVDFVVSLNIHAQRFSITFNNGQIPGNWFELHDVVVWYREEFATLPGEKKAIT